VQRARVDQRDAAGARDRLGDDPRADEVGRLGVLGVLEGQRPAGLRGGEEHAVGLPLQEAVDVLARAHVGGEHPRAAGLSASSSSRRVANQLSASTTSSPASSARSAIAAPTYPAPRMSRLCAIAPTT
jgi:hypothetical protein